MSRLPLQHYDPSCRRCDRLANFLDEVKREYPDYFCKPVPPFGDTNAKLLIVGLAPGKHGANASGRPFTGDYAGVLLYKTLHEFGFASKPESISSDDDLQLINCRISNAVKCLPPENKPIGSEVNNCKQFISAEIESLPAKSVLLALGGIAHKSVISILGLRQTDYPFSHAAKFELPDGRYLVSSYHCSRYNTQTRRLTPAMFRDVFTIVKELI
ncbi:MAG: uracil-DNA glycosylase [Arenicellales bacterium WSBS_2016_MAG_OTU3]